MEVGDAQGMHSAMLIECQRPGAVGVGIVRIADDARVVEVDHRLGDGEEQQADADAGRE